jgi:5-methylcytosine-specific restriction endonuclease McrA
VSEKYYKENREKEILRSAIWHREHPDKANMSGALYRSKNPDKIRGILQKWRCKNHEYQQYWRVMNPFSVKAYNHNRRILGKGLLASTVKAVYENNIKRYGTLTCYLCLRPISVGKDHLEHKTPLSRGGTNEYNNLDVACRSCNCSKHDKTLEELRDGTNFLAVA